VQTEAEIRLWVADGVANGLRPWFTKFSGVLHDERWLKPVEDLYRRYARWEKYLRNERPLARVGLVYSQQTAWFYGAKVEDHTLGWYQALIEARIPFEMVHDRLLDAPRLTPFKTLILPNIAALSASQCGQLRAFVQGGGSLIATCETSLCDEWGVKRTDFGLADLFGVTFKGRIEGPMQNSYLRLETDPATGKRHPLLAGLEDAPRIINGVRRVEVEPTRPFPAPPLTLIPSYPDLPMEKVYPRVPKTNLPQVFLRDAATDVVSDAPHSFARRSDSSRQSAASAEAKTAALRIPHSDTPHSALRIPHSDTPHSALRTQMAVSCTSPGTLTARFGRCCRWTISNCCATPSSGPLMKSRLSPLLAPACST
jgi:hypothetical protein